VIVTLATVIFFSMMMK